MIQGPGIYDTGFFVEAPALTYSWRIQRIRLETTPLVEVAPRSFQRDETRVSYVDVRATNAWNDDNGNGAYLLDCALLAPTPRRSG